MAYKPLLDPAVAEMSPNFYSAALKTQLSPEEQLMLNQNALAYKTAKTLLQYSNDKARNEFLQLDPMVQSAIRYMFPDKEQFMPKQNWLQSGYGKLVKGIGMGVTALSSPIIAGFQAAEMYGRAINLPYQLEQKREQGEKNILSLKVLSDTYYGKNNWRWDRVTDLEKKYGKALVTLARGVAEGRTPGEAIDLYGKFDKDMYAALQFMNNSPKRFDNFMRSVKVDAQVSWGRDIINKFVPTEAAADKAQTDSSHWAVKFTKFLGMDVTTKKGRLKAKEFTSGGLDGIYQIAIDPLSYVGIGLPVKTATLGTRGIKGVSIEEAGKLIGLKPKGERLADLYQIVSERAGTASAGIDWAFTQPDVRQLWDNEIGPLVKKYADSRTAAERSAIYNEIAYNYPDFANRKFIKELAHPEAKVFDANAAEKFFLEFDNFNRLLTSKVDGITYRRNGIPSAMFSRKIAVSAANAARAVFSKTANAKTSPEVLALIENEKELAMNVLTTVAKTDDDLINPMLPEVLEAAKDVTLTQKGLQKISETFSRSPGRILVGDAALDTVENFRSLAKQIFRPRVADALTEQFLDESIATQFTMIRNLYQSIMIKAGMMGSPGGEQHMATILASTFNPRGMGNTTRTEIPLDYMDEVLPAAFRMEQDVPVMTGKGIINLSQIQEGIAPLPYDEIYQYGAQSKLSQKINFVNAFGGITRNNIVRLYTDFWANQTLFPRLGIRSAVDEAFFMYLSAPLYNLRQYLSGTAIKPTRVLETITGSKEAIGMYRRGLYKVPMVGKLLDPTKKITPLQRYEGVKRLAKVESERLGYDVPESAISMSLIRQDVVRQAQEIYGDTLPKEMWENIRKLMKHNPQVLDSVVNSLAARASMSGKIDIDYIDTLFTPSNLSKMYEDFGLTATKNFRPIQVTEMGEKQIAIAHYRNFSNRFPYNSKTITKGVYLSPATAFFKNNGLRLGEAGKKDFNNARNELLEKIGVAFVKETNGFAITNEKTVKAFNDKFSSSVYSRQDGLNEADIARLHIERMLLDMRATFHGGPNAYNQKLMDVVNNRHKEIIDYRVQAQKGFEGAWEDATASLTFKEFENATVGFRPIGEINTDLISRGEVKDMKVFEEAKGLPELLMKFQNWTMEVMDAQVTGLYRQKALWIAYDKNMKDYKPLEKMYTDRYIKAGTKPREAANLAEKQVTEIAWKNAIEQVLQYVDNPNVRTNLATSVRSVARFYRATEDFYRRVYRSYGKTSLRTLYRLRLLNTGLDAAADIYEDDKGDKYIIFPTDTIINSAVEPVLRAFTGKEDLNIPTFNDLSLKLRLINPSFAPDAGQPALSGPIGAISTLTLQALTGGVVPFLERLNIISEKRAQTWQAKALNIEEFIGQVGLGNFADTMDFRKAITPMFYDTFLGAASAYLFDKAPFEDWERQQTSAINQAMRYHQAFGNGIDESASEDEKYKYQKGLKLSVANIIMAKTILGYISPGMPSFRETKEFPDFLKKIGITGFKPEFWDIYNGILRNADEDTSDVFDLAVATFVGKFPDKVIYTVPTSNREWKVVINTTGEVKDWAEKNSRFLDVYKELGWVYAPKVGEFNSDVYNFLESEGLISLPTFEEYLVRLQVAVDKEKYFSVQKELEEKLATTGIIQDRRELIDIAAKTKKDMLTANPYLEAEVNGNINERGELRTKFKAIAEANVDPRNPADEQTKKTMQLILEEVASFVNMAEDDYLSSRFDFTNLKEQKRIEVQAIIDEFVKTNPTIKEANRVVFKPLLNSYSRDAVQAGTGGK